MATNTCSNTIHASLLNHCIDKQNYQTSYMGLHMPRVLRVGQVWCKRTVTTRRHPCESLRLGSDKLKVPSGGRWSHEHSHQSPPRWCAMAACEGCHGKSGKGQEECQIWGHHAKEGWGNKCEHVPPSNPDGTSVLLVKGAVRKQWKIQTAAVGEIMEGTDGTRGLAVEWFWNLFLI